ncbi:MAG: hypothetical protein H7Y37_15265 [Anaerolineae bacterium]|nr:hypothetical protein [Gloeobacterales cyanobacterium ES-bin-313]
MRRSLFGFWVVISLLWASDAKAQVSVQVGNDGDVQVFTSDSNVSIVNGQVLTTNGGTTVIQRSYSYQGYGNPYNRPFRRKQRTIVRSRSGIVDQSVLIDVR